MITEKLRNLLLNIEYDGTNYKGWQSQRRKTLSLPTIQETLQKVLGKILQEDITLIGSGRTDSGVHALGQCANFKTSSDIQATKLEKALNALLPKDIRVKSVKQVNLDFHARFSAKSKVYRYLILNKGQNSAFNHRHVFYFSCPLNLTAMKEEAEVLLGRHNFSSFQASDKKLRDPVRTIKMISVNKREGLIKIDIEADGFLYNMVRIIAGTLIEAGRGKLPSGSVEKILRAENRKIAGPTAPSCGLYLIKVRY